MAERSPRFGLTGTKAGWVKRVGPAGAKVSKWIVSRKVAPDAAAADAYYFANFARIEGEAGRAAEAKRPARGAVTVGIVCNAYLSTRRAKLAAGRIDDRTMAEWVAVLKAFADVVGQDKPADALGPDDFAKVADAWAHYGYNVRRRRTLAVRSVFKWAADPPVRLLKPLYGPAFDVPAKVEGRRERARRRAERGLLLFSPAEIRAQLDGATVKRSNGRPMPVRPTPALRAMILLAVNCGFGNTDLAGLPFLVPNLDTGWVEYTRNKTGADRKAKMWPETVAAVRDYLAVRPRPSKPAYAGLLFLTSHGNPYVRHHRHSEARVERRDKIAERYGVLLGHMGQSKPGRNFYTLRRTYRTLAAETGEELAIDLSMGHAEDADDMARVYTVAVLDSKLEKVAAHVYARVFGVSLPSP